MRLVCPNCDAEYEVDRNMIPTGGRDVQCSNCATTWFQMPSADEDGMDAGAVPFVAARPRAPKIDPAAMNIIREEVARETGQRQQEANSARNGPDDEEEATPEVQTASDQAQEQSPERPQKKQDTKRKQSERLPDIEEINSNLSPQAADAAAAEALHHDEDAGRKAYRARRRGFRLGFVLVLLCAVALLGVYIYSDEVSEQAPTLAAKIDAYVTFVDEKRYSLDDLAQHLIDQITAIMEKTQTS